MKTCPHCSSGYHDSHTTCPTHGVLLNEIRELKPGMLIHNTYQIVRKLGEGGMGIVYLAENIQMDREPRALKFLSSRLSSDESFTSRLRREVRALREVRNQNVVDCNDLVAAEDGSLFFSMEFVNGPDLCGFMHGAGRSLKVPQALAIIRGIALGLGAAHAKQIVHRDIKPENILMAPEGDHWIPKIVDFGIVATKESSETYRTTRGTLLTPPYAAPEQWLGVKAALLDGRTDLYALGGVLFEMLTGETVFQGESYEEWAELHKKAAPRAPSLMRPDLARWIGLDALVLHLLAKDRQSRPANVAEFLRELDAIRERSVPEPVPIPVERITRVEEFVDKRAVAQVHAAEKSVSQENRKTPEIDPLEKWRQDTAGKKTEQAKGVRRIGWVLVVIAVVGIGGYGLSQYWPDSTSPAHSAEFGGNANNQAQVPPRVIDDPKPKPQPQPTEALLSVSCDQACNWTLNGAPETRIEAGESRSVSSRSEGTANVVAWAVGGCSGTQQRQVTMSLGRRADARFEFRTVEERCQQQLIANLMQQAERKDKSGDLAGAVQDYRKVLQLNPPRDVADQVRTKIEEIQKVCGGLGLSC
jgi:serine/threonine protein kinase